MEIVHNISLSSKSLEYISKTFDKYEEIKYDTERVLKDPVVHMYPTQDTLSDDKDSLGYEDSLLVTVKVYDYHEKVFMQISNRDALDFYDKNVRIKQVRVFKDGSTMVMLKGAYKFGRCQNVEILSV